MKPFISIIVLISFLAFAMQSCNGEDNGNSEANTSGDTELAIVESDKTTPGNRVLSFEDSTGEGDEIHIVVEAQDFDFSTLLRLATFLDEDGTILQTNKGNVKIDTTRDWTTIILKNAPSDFAKIDFWFDGFYLGGGDVGGFGTADLGGGDVGGHGIENLGGGDVGGLDVNNLGGGDVGGLETVGIIIPHFVLTRNQDVRWNSVSLRIPVEQTQFVDSNQRKIFAQTVVGNSKVFQEETLAGIGDAESTALLNNRWPAVVSGQQKCYDSLGVVMACPGTAGTSECVESAYCGQDAQYAMDRGWLFPDESTVYDPATQLTWLREPVQCGGQGCSYEEANDYCASQQMRLPNLWEARTILDFGRSRPVLPEEFGSLDDLLWTAPLPGSDVEGWVIDLATGKPKPNEATTEGITVCVQGKEFTEYEDIFPNQADTLSGLMWNHLTTTHDWESALSACESSVNLGFSDWRLPNIAELSLLLFRESLELESTWSSTTFDDQPAEAWVLSPPGWDTKPKTDQKSVYCVRTIP